MANEEIELTTEEFEAAKLAGKESEENEPHAAKAWFDAGKRLVFIELKKTGIVMGFPVKLLQGVSEGSDEQIAAVELSPSGYGLMWEELDSHLSVPGLVAGTFGTKKWMSELGRKGGSVKSTAKAKSSRENGKLGGRPKKKTA